MPSATSQWERIIWGETPYLLGRIPKAILISIQAVTSGEQFPLIICGTGASGKDGVMEGEYIVQCMFKNIDTLADFCVFSSLQEKKLNLHDELRKAVRSEIQSKNTLQEIKAVADIFAKEKVERMILISSPTHLPRCLRDACSVLADEGFEQLRNNLFASPSDTCYANTVSDDVSIIELLHRGDRDGFSLHHLAQRMLVIDSDKKGAFAHEYSELLSKYRA